jgi:YD repeat-containing protein
MTNQTRVLVLSALVALLSFPLHGQRGITDAITPPAAEIGETAGSYVLSGFESVSHYSGKLHFALPLLSVGGRGEAGYTMTLALDRGWQFQAQLDGNGAPVSYFAVSNFWATSHWWGDLGAPMLSPGRLVSRRSGSGNVPCSMGGTAYHSVLTRLTFISGDGTETELVDKPSGGNEWFFGPACVSLDSRTRPGPFVSRDGSAITFEPASPIVDEQDPAPGRDQGSPSGTLYFRDGRRYQVTTGLVTAIMDRNGNRTDLTYDWAGRLVTVTDPLGRIVTVDHNLAGGGVEITWKRNANQNRSLKIRYGALSGALASGQALKTYDELWGNYGGSSVHFNPQVVTAVELPDGRSYTLKYNSYGELAEARLPTNGAYRYQWGGSAVYNAGKPFAVRRVTKREVFSEGEISAGGMEFFYESGSLSIDGLTYPYTKVTETPFGAGVSGTKEYFYYGHAEQPDDQQGYDIPRTYWRQGREYMSKVSASSDVLQTTSQTWTQRPCEAGQDVCPTQFVQIDPRVTERIQTLNETGEALKTVTAYDRYNNPIEVWEYDLPLSGGETLVRRVTTSYETSAAYVEAPAHLRSLVRVAAVYGSGLAEMNETLYDEQTLINNPGMPGYIAPASAARGNPTTVRRQVDFPSTRWLTSTRTFDIAGNVRSVTDPRGKTTTATYSSTTGYGFPSEIVNPLDHTTTLTWDQFLGRPLTVSGPNTGETTSYEYKIQDSLDRLSKVTRPVGSTVYDYDDTARTRTARTAQDSCEATQSEDFREEFDGLGRLVKIAQVEDSTEIVVRTEYDGQGRRRWVSFPYRGASTGSTEFAYDALGRPTSESVSSGAITATTTYAHDGRKTTITDPDSNVREMSYDAIGRLVEVKEAASDDYLTTYSYDGAGRLTGVTQGAQTRGFGYDTAGRLLSATNPENNTIQYRYDDAGNLVQRTDARGVTTCTGYQATTLCTDAAAARDGLNRVVKKSYTGDSTPQVTYT